MWDEDMMRCDAVEYSNSILEKQVGILFSNMNKRLKKDVMLAFKIKLHVKKKL